MEINNKKNLFREGKFAKGDYFIGRKKLLSELMELWKGNNGVGSRSVVGLNRMGKSSLAVQFMDMIENEYPDTVCVRFELKDTLPVSLQHVMSEISNQEGLDPKIYDICQETCSIVIDNYIKENRVMRNYKNLITYMDEIGQKYLMIIDEFDSARICWKNKANYFFSLRDYMQLNLFCIIISRRPLEVIAPCNDGQSCFHNVFPEINVCAFNENDMKEYYSLLEENYHVALDESERKLLEEYTGFCPALLTAVGYHLAADAINNRVRQSIENICTNADFRNNCIKHYKEFLSRMQEDGLWDDVVRILMGISPTLVEAVGRNTFDESRLQIMEVKGYLHKQDGQYVVFSDDFTAWAQSSLFRNEIDTIYSTIIRAEVAIREMLRQEMPVIWNQKYNQDNWEEDIINNVNVPQSVNFFTKIQQNGNSIIRTYLRKAQRYNPTATPVDAMTMPVKLSLIEEYWEDGIKTRFNSESYFEWEDYFKSLGEIRNYVFHPVISLDNVSNENYHLLKNVNDAASKIINQLFQ